MGTDRKRPLAAFIVVTVIAVILLVTSVRSQAAPGWLDRRLPPSVVAVVPTPGDSGLWRAVGDGMDEVVRHGTALAHTVDGDEPTTENALAAASLLVTGTLPPPARPATSTPRATPAVTPAATPLLSLSPSHPTTHHRPGVDRPSGQSARRPRPAHHEPSDPADSPVDRPGGAGEDHGRHHGWQGSAPGLWGGGMHGDAGGGGDWPLGERDHGDDTSTGEPSDGGRGDEDNPANADNRGDSHDSGRGNDDGDHGHDDKAGDRGP